MIRHTISNLRSPDWSPISLRDLKERLDNENDGEPETWTVTPWVRHGGCSPRRAYLLTSNEGAIYAIFFRKL